MCKSLYFLIRHIHPVASCHFKFENRSSYAKVIGGQTQWLPPLKWAHHRPTQSCCYLFLKVSIYKTCNPNVIVACFFIIEKCPFRRPNKKSDHIRCTMKKSEHIRITCLISCEWCYFKSYCGSYVASLLSTTSHYGRGPWTSKFESHWNSSKRLHHGSWAFKCNVNTYTIRLSTECYFINILFMWTLLHNRL